MATDTIRKFTILLVVAKYRTLTRKQIQRLAGYDGKKNDDRCCRRHLLEMVQAAMLSKSRTEVIASSAGAPAPTYGITKKGLELLAAETGDESYLTRDCSQVNWQLLLHATEVSEFFIRLDAAIELQGDAGSVQIDRRLTEFDVANAQERDPDKRYKLFTEIRKQPRLVCNPDAAFLLRYKENRKVYYLELSRGTSGIQQIAASKTPGFAALAEHSLHTRHFPETNIGGFSVLFIEPSAGRRDLLWKVLAKKDGAAMYKVAAWPDIRPETLLFEPIWFDTEGKPFSLVRRISSNSQAISGLSAMGPESCPESARPGQGGRHERI